MPSPNHTVYTLPLIDCFYRHVILLDWWSHKQVGQEKNVSSSTSHAIERQKRKKNLMSIPSKFKHLLIKPFFFYIGRNSQMRENAGFFCHRTTPYGGTFSPGTLQAPKTTTSTYLRCLMSCEASAAIPFFFHQKNTYMFAHVFTHPVDNLHTGDRIVATRFTQTHRDSSYS